MGWPWRTMFELDLGLLLVWELRLFPGASRGVCPLLFGIVSLLFPFSFPAQIQPPASRPTAIVVTILKRTRVLLFGIHYFLISRTYDGFYSNGQSISTGFSLSPAYKFI